MHAAFVLPRFYPYRGGYENSMLAIGQCLVKRGHRVSVFTTVADDLESLWVPGYKTFPEEDFVVDGVQVRRFRICYRKWRRRATRFLGLMPYWRWKAQFWKPAFRVPALDEALQNCDADLFHIGPLPYNNLMFAGLNAAEFRNVTAIATPCVHLGESNNDEVLRHYLQPHQLELLRHCDRVLCMTDVEQDFLRQSGVREEKLETIGHGINFSQATGGSAERVLRRYGIDGPVVLHLGVKAYEKGSMTLIKAMQLLWAKGLPAWLVMAGPSMSEFERFLARQTEPMPKLVNLPQFADEDKKDLLAAATIVAQPSRVESLGLIALEAMANGKPVVAADIKVSRKLVANSGAGVVTPFGESTVLAQELNQLLNGEKLRNTMGLKGLAVAEKFDAARLFERNAAALEEMASIGALRERKKDEPN